MRPDVLAAPPVGPQSHPLARATRLAARVAGCPVAVLGVDLGEGMSCRVAHGVGFEEGHRMMTSGMGLLADGRVGEPNDSTECFVTSVSVPMAQYGFCIALSMACPKSNTYGLLVLADPRARSLTCEERSLLDDVVGTLSDQFALLRRQRQDFVQTKLQGERFRALVQANAQVVWVCDRRGEVEEITGMWEALTGQTPDQVRRWGWLRAIVEEDRTRLRDQWKAALHAQRPFEATFRLVLKNGQRRWYNLRAVPVLNPDGTFREFVGRFADAHDSHEAREQLRESEERMRLAFEASRMGMWEWDFEKQRVLLTPVAYELLGVTAETFDVEAWAQLAYVHPDDRAAVAANAQAMRETDAFEISYEHRTCTPRGEEHWVRSVSKVFRNELGEPVRLIGTLADITAAKSYEAALVEAKERAEDMVRLRDAFLANMSHEIRTPLTAILGFTDLLRQELPDELREYAELIEIGGRRLNDTLTSILELAQLNAGMHVLHVGRVEAASVVDDVMRTFGASAAQRGLVLQCRLSDRVPPVIADRAGLVRVLENLVSNAIKFTSAGAVTVELEPLGAGVAIRVRDTGKGISPDFLPHLFSEFRQESTGLSRGYEGVGLGLAIAHRLVTMMGGDLAVESTPEVGSTFTVWLPSAEALAA